MKPHELLKHIYSTPEHLPLNRSHREFEAISPESLQGLESQSSLAKTAHLDSVFDVGLFSEGIREIVELFENDEYETASKKIRTAEKTTETEKGLLLLQMLKLYADSSLWVTSPEEKFRTRIEQTYTDIHTEVYKQLNKELAEQFQQNAVSLIRQM